MKGCCGCCAPARATATDATNTAAQNQPHNFRTVRVIQGLQRQRQGAAQAYATPIPCRNRLAGRPVDVCACPGCVCAYDFTASTSSEIFTSSPTRNPPVSSAAFHVSPKSL